jgi:hypothetical protein
MWHVEAFFKKKYCSHLKIKILLHVCNKSLLTLLFACISFKIFGKRSGRLITLIKSSRIGMSPLTPNGLFTKLRTLGTRVYGP